MVRSSLSPLRERRRPPYCQLAFCTLRFALGGNAPQEDRLALSGTACPLVGAVTQSPALERGTPEAPMPRCTSATFSGDRHARRDRPRPSIDQWIGRLNTNATSPCLLHQCSISAVMSHGTFRAKLKRRPPSSLELKGWCWLFSARVLHWLLGVVPVAAFGQSLQAAGQAELMVDQAHD